MTQLISKVTLKELNVNITCLLASNIFQNFAFHEEYPVLAQIAQINLLGPLVIYKN